MNFKAVYLPDKNHTPYLPASLRQQLLGRVIPKPFDWHESSFVK